MTERLIVSVAIERDWQDVYERLWRPEAFAAWASGLATGNLREEEGEWRADGPEGPVAIRFSPHNALGVMDHWVDIGAGRIVHVPLRVIACGDGCQVQLTLMRQPGMSDDDFARDSDWVRRDLAALKALVEG